MISALAFIYMEIKQIKHDGTIAVVMLCELVFEICIAAMIADTIQKLT